MTSWHHKISLIYFHFNYGKTSSIWSFRPIASSLPITLGRSRPEIKKCPPPLLQIHSHWNLSACFFTKKSILLYVRVTVPRMAEQNTKKRANEARSKAKQTKRSIEGHGKYLIDSTYTAPDTWISLKKKKHVLSLHFVHLTCSQRSLLCITVWLFLALFKVSGWTLHEASKTLA